MDAVYAPSEDVVAREIEGELIIVPLVAGIGDMEDELYTLNETGRAIWDRLDGKTQPGRGGRGPGRGLRCADPARSSTTCSAWWRSWSGGGCWLRSQQLMTAAPGSSSSRPQDLPLSGQALLDLMRAVLAKGVPFRFCARGWSMAPFIRDGDVITVSPLRQSLPGVGEVVAFVRPEDRQPGGAPGGGPARRRPCSSREITCRSWLRMGSSPRRTCWDG